MPRRVHVDAAREAGASVFAVGTFVMAVINFLVIAFVVFMERALLASAAPPMATAPCGK